VKSLNRRAAELEAVGRYEEGQMNKRPLYLKYLKKISNGTPGDTANRAADLGR
jgi:hypothetical protein